MVLNKSAVQIRKRGSDEDIPYVMLLLGDYTMEAINQYAINAEMYTMEYYGEEIGIYALTRLDKINYEIKSIAIHEQFRGTGLGQLLLEHATNTSRNDGAHYLWIGTSNMAFKQMRMFQKAGFEMHSVREEFFVNKEVYPYERYKEEVLIKHMLMFRKAL